MNPERQQMRREFARDVRLMRKLGVARWGEIVLDPRMPLPGQEKEPLTPEQLREKERQAEETRHRTLFASSSVRPIRGPGPVREIPKSVVQGAERAAEHDGQAKPGT